jgi:hypothetical protein
VFAAVDVGINKAPANLTVPVDGTGSYTMTVSNNLAQAVTDVVTENIPAGLQVDTLPAGMTVLTVGTDLPYCTVCFVVCLKPHQAQ